MTKPEQLATLVCRALEEDVGQGDVTSMWTLPPGLRGRGAFVSKGQGILAGMEVAGEVFRQVSPEVRLDALRVDGAAIAPGDILGTVKGPMAAILTAERTALNLMQRMSGIATATRRYVDAVRGTRAVILDTRKTTPLLRHLEKVAVIHGGGANHRFGLFDMLLIKENHLAAAGGGAAAIQRAKQNQKDLGIPSPLALEVEIQDLSQLDDVLEAGVDRIMLDNFPLKAIRVAVRRIKGKIPIEVSGGVTLENVRNIARCGVDFISVGALTHSAPAHDFSLLVPS